MRSTDGLMTWHAGYQSPTGNYVALEQTKDATRGWVSAQTNRARRTGEVQAAGKTWRTYVRSGKVQNSLLSTAETRRRPHDDHDRHRHLRGAHGLRRDARAGPALRPAAPGPGDGPLGPRRGWPDRGSASARGAPPSAWRRVATRVSPDRRSRGVGVGERGLGAVEPGAAVGRQGLAALPQPHALLEAELTALELGDDADELVAGLLVGQVGDVRELVCRGGGRLAALGHGDHPRAARRRGPRSRRGPPAPAAARRPRPRPGR